MKNHNNEEAIAGDPSWIIVGKRGYGSINGPCGRHPIGRDMRGGELEERRKGLAEICQRSVLNISSKDLDIETLNAKGMGFIPWGREPKNEEIRQEFERYSFRVRKRHVM